MKSLPKFLSISTLAALSLAIAATSALAATSNDAAPAAHEYKQFYLVNGKEVSAQDAIIAGIRGNEAFQCKSVQAAVSKSGTSISVKAIKKPKKL